MISMLANHLWQSTAFAVAAGLLTLLFRRNRGRVRYAVWLAVSQPRVPREAAQVARPLFPALLLAVWFSGFTAIIFYWGVRWYRFRLAVRAATPLDVGASIRTMSSTACVEPGIFGVFKPTLLLPQGIAERLTPEQLAAVVVHELCHVRRRDNLAAAAHMVVEAVFWFHPLVWWIGARLIEERERACDEEVLATGTQPQVYAEGILNVCKFYVESPLACVSGVTGSNLKKRIEEIMTHRISRELNFGRKLLLAAAGCAAVTAPIAIGVLHAPQLRAQQPSGPTVTFEVASVKPNTSRERISLAGEALPGGTPKFVNIPLRLIITDAYNLPVQSPARLSGAPDWTVSERYDIEAKAAPGAVPAGLSEKARNEKLMPMLQALLVDRFKLAVHWETQQLPVYSLVVSKNGLKLHTPKMAEKDCPEVSSSDGYCHLFTGGQGNGIHGKTVEMTELVTFLESWTDRPVIDNTGFKGLFDIDTSGWIPMRLRPSPLPGAAPSAEDRAFADPARPTLQAVLSKVGLKLESSRGPVDVVVIDHVERPTEN